MLLLTATTDNISLTHGTTSELDVHTSYIDMTQAAPPVVQGDTSGRTNSTFTTAGTDDIVPSPASSETRNVKTIHVRNVHASIATDVTINFDQNGTLFELHKANLQPGEQLEYVEGIGFFEVASSSPVQTWTNKSTAAQEPGFSSDTYLTGSSIRLDALGAPVIGLMYDCSFSVAKTGAGTATPIVQVRVGTAGAVGDTSRLSFTFSAGTAATDVGEFRVQALFRAVGGSAIMQGHCSLKSQPTTGFSSLLKGVQTTSGTFDSGVANSIIGISVNGGTSASWTVQLVEAELVKR